MSHAEDLSARANFVVNQLKYLWREKLSDDQKDFWREQFGSELTQAQLRKLLFTHVSVELKYDMQLTRFRRWVIKQDQRLEQAEHMLENQTAIEKEHPDWTKDHVRDEVIKAAYYETLASGDFALGLKTIRQDLNIQKNVMDRDKLEFLKSKAKKSDAAKEVTVNRILTPEEKMAEYRRIFGMI